MSASAPSATRPADFPASPPPGLKRIGAKPTLREYVRDLIDHRDFLVTVPLGELRAQNQNSVLGSFWHLLNPLLLAGVYYLIFGIIFQAANDIPYYPAFLIVGIMTFTYIGKVMQSGARTVVANLKLIQSIQFPRASLPIATGISEFIAHLPAVLTMMVLVIITSHFAQDPTAPQGVARSLPAIYPTWSWLLLIPATLIMSLFGLGLALFTARATFHFQDVQQLLPYTLRIWMYLSGMFYNIDFVAKKAHGHYWIVQLFKANPMYEFFAMFRGALIGVNIHTVGSTKTLVYDSFDPKVWAMATAWAVVTVVAGFLYFRAHETEYGRG